MPSLNEKLLADMKEAMKQREAGKLRLATIRMVRAAQKEAEVARKRELEDEELLELIIREVKKRKDAIPEYEKANRPDAVKQLEEEIAVLKEYLPDELDESELRRIIRDVIEETRAGSIKDMGKVMQILMPRVRGRADGKVISQLVNEMLK